MTTLGTLNIRAIIATTNKLYCSYVQKLVVLTIITYTCVLIYNLPVTVAVNGSSLQANSPS